MYSGYLCVGVHAYACELCVSLHVCVRLCTCVCMRGVCVCVSCVLSIRACVYELYVCCVCVSAHVCMYELCVCVHVYEGVCLSVCMCVSCVYLCVHVSMSCACVCVCELLKLRPSDFRDLDNGEETEWDHCWSLDSGLPVLAGWMAG